MIQVNKFVYLFSINFQFHTPYLQSESYKWFSSVRSIIIAMESCEELITAMEEAGKQFESLYMLSEKEERSEYAHFLLFYYIPHFSSPGGVGGGAGLGISLYQCWNPHHIVFLTSRLGCGGRGEVFVGVQQGTRMGSRQIG